MDLGLATRTAPLVVPGMGWTQDWPPERFLQESLAQEGPGTGTGHQNGHQEHLAWAGHQNGPQEHLAWAGHQNGHQEYLAWDGHQSGHQESPAPAKAVPGQGPAPGMALPDPPKPPKGADPLPSASGWARQERGWVLQGMGSNTPRAPRAPALPGVLPKFHPKKRGFLQNPIFTLCSTPKNGVFLQNPIFTPCSTPKTRVFCKIPFSLRVPPPKPGFFAKSHFHSVFHPKKMGFFAKSHFYSMFHPKKKGVFCKIPFSLRVPPQKTGFFCKIPFLFHVPPKNHVLFQGTQERAVPTGQCPPGFPFWRPPTLTPHSKSGSRHCPRLSGGNNGKRRLLRKGFTPGIGLWDHPAPSWGLPAQTRPPLTSGTPIRNPQTQFGGARLGWGGQSGPAPAWGQQLHNKQSPAQAAN
ncbi:uncharacterized protein LOC134561458 [Prinia subflava]|uniref:uncharacterized protein LOC134561458 n=1 Tax=Prinia subflava TaxID=208062 RepID=UPI002FE20BF5